MSRDELRVLAWHLLGEARSVRDAHGHTGGAGGLPVSAVPSVPPPGDAGAADLWASLGHLRAEVLRVRDGEAGSLMMLGAEIALTEGLFVRL